MSEAARILPAVQHNDRSTAEKLLPLVYDDLRQLAARKLTREKPGQTLEAMALVHEAYARLVGEGEAECQKLHWDGPWHFFAAAARAMRRVLIDRAREKLAAKRGGGRKRLDIDAASLAIQAGPDQLLAIDDALAKLSREDPTAARLVELRYLSGLTVQEAANSLGISTATAYRHCNYARICLYGELLGAAKS